MTHRNDIKTVDPLRQQAENLLNKRVETDEKLMGRSSEEIARIVHDLQVHQIELAMQNDELQRTRTELERARDRYAHLYDFAPVGYFTVEEKGSIVSANLTAADLLGRPRAQIVNRMFSQWIFPDDQDIWYLSRKRLLNGDAFQSFSLRMLKSNGSAFHASLECLRVENSDTHEQLQFRIAVVDITARKQVEEALQQLNDTLEQRVAERTAEAEARTRQLQTLAVELIEAEERERRRVAEYLHDDLQQILAAARMQLDMACQSQPEEPLLVSVRQLITESIEKSRRLSHELSPPVLYHADLRAALEWMAQHYKEQFGMQVALDIDAEHFLEKTPLKPFVFRTVQELLFNVVKHAGVQSARVALARSGAGLSVTVSDRGRGFNGDISGSHSASTGLGLLSLRERARYVGGDLVIESAPGLGSRITLTVPLSIPEPDARKRPMARRRGDIPIQAAEAFGAAVKRVLFVDDHKVMRQGLINLIGTQPGIQVVGEASDGREAIARVEQLKPDVVVMDVSMPGMDGIEATRRIKSKWPKVRVIGLSMIEEEQISRTMHDAGAEAFVSKTASSAELLKAIFGIRP